jgi:hypothetical protein
MKRRITWPRATDAALWLVICGLYAWMFLAIIAPA